MMKCLLLRPGLIAGPLHSTPLQIISQSIPRLDPIDSKSSQTFYHPNSSRNVVLMENSGSKRDFSSCWAKIAKKRS